MRASEIAAAEAVEFQKDARTAGGFLGLEDARFLRVGLDGAMKPPSQSALELRYSTTTFATQGTSPLWINPCWVS